MEPSQSDGTRSTFAVSERVCEIFPEFIFGGSSADTRNQLFSPGQRGWCSGAQTVKEKSGTLLSLLKIKHLSEMFLTVGFFTICQLVRGGQYWTFKIYGLVAEAQAMLRVCKDDMAVRTGSLCCSLTRQDGDPSQGMP
ncbi:hypothetical protein EXN66_Car018989 [Channa argus]|uniref:Uncharacterized protein n=1 Tax=Channa argus TaxID=215402 RepID=A0A6G1QKV1_CHAAH|nr:hypothetical protein EXN66_Car018989 [Channa argus]